MDDLIGKLENIHHQLMAEHHESHTDKNDKHTHLKSAGCKASGFLLVSLSNRVRYFNLASHFRHRCTAIGNPKINTSGSDGRHSTASQSANPNHVYQIIGHLDESCHHNGHR